MAVHESCYGMDPEIVGDDNSTESASITEPWFCEPCIYGEKEPPHCELCPVRYGALKRSGIYLYEAVLCLIVILQISVGVGYIFFVHCIHLGSHSVMSRDLQPYLGRKSIISSLEKGYV